MIKIDADIHKIHVLDKRLYLRIYASIIHIYRVSE